ncbi:MAG: PEP-CTERM sorting domain-containing protein [Verrucomicrobiaceae bacterium]|nr:MAG: PEP-CTERM sorting domain-containing protein [Verrucomicrobiaceae bacterium]
MKSLPPGRTISVLLSLVPLTASAQNFVDLNFKNNVQQTNATNPNNSTLGPAYFAGLTLDFVNVAFVNGLAVDARVTLNWAAGNPISPGYEFVGYIPDYNKTNNGPGGDLGVYYRSINGYDTVPYTGGISYTITFYEGGNSFTTEQTLSNFRFLIYDHDGEKDQSESIRTFESDGFVGYQIGSKSGITTHNENGIWDFDSRGWNHPEDSADGGFIAYYENTSSVRFDMYATTSPDLPYAYNGVFAAFDGDLSVNGKTTDGFNSYVPVPEPSTPLLVLGATTLALLRRTRQS